MGELSQWGEGEERVIIRRKRTTSKIKNER